MSSWKLTKLGNAWKLKWLAPKIDEIASYDELFGLSIKYSFKFDGLIYNSLPISLKLLVTNLKLSIILVLEFWFFLANVSSTVLLVPLPHWKTKWSISLEPPSHLS